jgi:N-acetyl sugar amidotransferase
MYQICNNCVMDTSDQDIVFDEDGICDHCNTYYQKILPNWHTDEKGNIKLQKILNKIKKDGNGKDFDCIIGMSGGIDSSYLTYIAKKKFDLRPLIFHVDAGWNSQIAVNNIEKLVDKLGLDLFTEVINWNEMRDLQLSYFKSGLPNIDTPQDHAFFAMMYKFAEKYKVKNILTGANLSTECIRNPISWMYYQSDVVQLKDVQKKFGKIKIKDFPTTNILKHKIILPYLKNIKTFRLLNYINYNKKNAIELLSKNFDWQPYPQKHFESRFTKFYESYWLFERFGYDVRRVQFSSLILTNQMKRSDAIKILKDKPYDVENIKHDIEFVANKLQVSVTDIDNFFNLPKKNYKDYRSQKNLYTIGSFIMKFLNIELGGKR